LLFFNTHYSFGLSSLTNWFYFDIDEKTKFRTKESYFFVLFGELNQQVREIKKEIY